MVEVFKTNLNQQRVRPVIKALTESFPACKINVDMEDCDKILRIEGELVSAKEIMKMLAKEGFQCAVLDY